MPRLFILFNGVVFLLSLTLFLNFAVAYDDILKCKIKDQFNNEVEFNWKKTDQILANENLPIWFADFEQTADGNNRVVHKLQKNFIKEKIGHFIFYHDAETSSSVVLFTSTNIIYGFIDTRFIIRSLPLDQCAPNHFIDRKYLLKRKNHFGVHDYLQSFDSPSSRSEEFEHDYYHNKPSTSAQSQYPTSDQNEPPKKRQRLDDDRDQKKIFYPEILIFIPYELTAVLKPLSRAYLTHVVVHFIIYFNVVDLLFSQLSTDDIKIHLNLAGIVIERQSGVFDFAVPTQIRHPKLNNAEPVQVLGVMSTFLAMNNYLKVHSDTFTDDSYDLFFVPSKHKLWLYGHAKTLAGVSNKYALYDVRRSYPIKYLKAGLLVDQLDGCESANAAHEIAHLFAITHDPLNEGRVGERHQCYAIMQQSAPACQHCIKWSVKSVEELKTFASENRNRCFFLNEPRSLRPYGTRVKTLTRLQQCKCFGFEHWPKNKAEDYVDQVSSDSCHAKAICGIGTEEVIPISTILPFDGTPCGIDKVCWNKHCQNVDHVSGSALRNRPVNI